MIGYMCTLWQEVCYEIHIICMQYSQPCIYLCTCPPLPQVSVDGELVKCSDLFSDQLSLAELKVL